MAALQWRSFKGMIVQHKYSFTRYLLKFQHVRSDIARWFLDSLFSWIFFYRNKWILEREMGTHELVHQYAPPADKVPLRPQQLMVPSLVTMSGVFRQFLWVRFSSLRLHTASRLHTTRLEGFLFVNAIPLFQTENTRRRNYSTYFHEIAHGCPSIISVR